MAADYPYKYSEYVQVLKEKEFQQTLRNKMIEARRMAAVARLESDVSGLSVHWSMVFIGGTLKLENDCVTESLCSVRYCYIVVISISPGGDSCWREEWSIEDGESVQPAAGQTARDSDKGVHGPSYEGVIMKLIQKCVYCPLSLPRPRSSLYLYLVQLAQCINLSNLNDRAPALHT